MLAARATAKTVLLALLFIGYPILLAVLRVSTAGRPLLGCLNAAQRRCLAASLLCLDFCPANRYCLDHLPSSMLAVIRPIFMSGSAATAVSITCAQSAKLKPS